LQSLTNCLEIVWETHGERDQKLDESLNYRNILLQEYKKRKEFNPQYSRVAFAKKIGLPASQLHDILKRRYGLSVERAFNISEKLGFDKYKQSLFCTLVESEHSRSRTHRQSAQKKLKLILKKLQITRMAIDKFKLISDWPHFAIMELIELKNFQPNVSWIANRLGITEERAFQAVSRLERLRLLKINGPKWKIATDATLVGGEQPSATIRLFHKNVLTRAIKALEQQCISDREFISATFAMNKDQIPQAKKKLQNFLEDFSLEYTKVNDKDCVYNLSLQLFEVTLSDEPQT
jgi:uncharacterized protein (TIGR02147 family)